MPPPVGQQILAIGISQSSTKLWPKIGFDHISRSVGHLESDDLDKSTQLFILRYQRTTFEVNISIQYRVMAQNRFWPYMAVSWPSLMRRIWQKVNSAVRFEVQCTFFEVNISIQHGDMALNRFRPYMAVSQPSWIRRIWQNVNSAVRFEVPTHLFWSQYLNPVPSYGLK